MLSERDLQDLITSGELVEWHAPGILSVRRRVLGTVNAINALRGPWPARSGELADGTPFTLTAAESEDGRRELTDVLALWQTGQRMVANAQIKPMKPPPRCDGVWEFRATRTPPQSRALGFFPIRNIFVATGVYPRDKLKERGSQGWNSAIGFAAGRGAAWFAAGPPLAWNFAKAFGQADLVGICDVF